MQVVDNLITCILAVAAAILAVSAKVEHPPVQANPPAPPAVSQVRSIPQPSQTDKCCASTDTVRRPQIAFVLFSSKY